jgi:hypothetical protein
MMIERFKTPRTRAEFHKMLYLLLEDGLEPFCDSVTDQREMIDLEMSTHIVGDDVPNLSLVIMDRDQRIAYHRFLEETSPQVDDDDDEDDDDNPVEFKVGVN